MLRSLIVVTLTTMALCLPFGIKAQTGATDDEIALFNAIGLDDMIEIIAEEGQSDARTLSESFFPGRPPEDLVQAAGKVYDRETMRDTVLTAWSGALPSETIAALRTFYESDLGQEVVMREISARRAMMNDDVEEAAYEAVEVMRAEAPARLAQLDRMIVAYDLLNGNVAGALNANFAFYRGLADGGGMLGGFDEGQVLADVWSQEPQVRTDTQDWLYAYLGLSYAGLEDAQFSRYLDFCETPEAQALNRVIFAAFGGLFEDLSRNMALAVARRVGAEDI